MRSVLLPRVRQADRSRRSRAGLALLALLLTAAACSSSDTGELGAAVDPTVGPTAAAASGGPTPAGGPTAAVPAPTATPPTSASQTPTPAAAPSGTPAPSPTPQVADPDPSAVSLALEQVAVLDAPIAMALRPGDPILYVAERAGRVVPLTPDGQVGPPIIDLSARTTTDSERGLLGLTWSADGDTLYLSSTDTEGASVLSAVEVLDGVLQVEDVRTLLRVPQPASNHNGGDLHLGPDGMLWWSLGDGGAADDRFGNGQRPDTLLGTILRVDPAGDPYGIPADNPFADGVQGAPEVWAYGLRNPFRFSFDPPEGTVWVADVGQNAVEEVNRVPLTRGGLNYGWPRLEGDRPFDGRPVDGPTVAPVHTYDHGRGCSVTGGRVYRGEALGANMQGVYLYSDFCDGRVFALEVAPDGTARQDVDTGLSLSSPSGFGVDAQGEVYILSLSGPVLKVVPA